MSEEHTPLTPKQAAFVREYLVDLNATQAAKRAGYSEKTAYSQGQRLLKHVEVQAAIAEAQAQRAKRTEVTADEVIEHLAAIARGEVRTEVSTRAGVVELPPSFAERIRALELLGKHIGMFTDRVDVTSGGQPLKAYVGFDPDQV